jgi:hypothetical protein
VSRNTAERIATNALDDIFVVCRYTIS